MVRADILFPYSLIFEDIVQNSLMLILKLADFLLYCFFRLENVCFSKILGVVAFHTFISFWDISWKTTDSCNFLRKRQKSWAILFTAPCICARVPAYHISMIAYRRTKTLFSITSKSVSVSISSSTAFPCSFCISDLVLAICLYNIHR